jgi:hypothetical protein
MMQLLAGAGPYALTKTWYVDGSPTDVGTVTVGIVDGNGTEVVAAGTATTNNADGTYSYSLADQANPNHLVITWTRTSTGADLTDRVELVGNWLFTESQARSFAAKADATSALKPLASETEYPDAIIADERTRIADDLEYWTGRSWIPRYARVELSGNGTSSLQLRKGVCRTSDGYVLNAPGRSNDIAVLLSASVGGTAVTLSNIEIDPIRENLIHKAGVWTAATVADPYNVVVEFVYGPPYLVDGVDRIAMKILVDRLVPSAYPDRALRIDGDYGSMQLVQPGGPMKNVSRVPEVNQWVQAHNHKVLVG